MTRPPRHLAVFIDGTWNRPGTAETTNVRKLYEATREGLVHGHLQARLYLPGVGARPEVDAQGWPAAGLRATLAPYLQREMRTGRAAALLRAGTGGVFGRGTAARIRAAYHAICQDFDAARGDRIYLFGFSRGAFAARSLAGFMEKVGLLLRHRLAHVEQAWRLYEQGTDASHSALAAYLYALTGQHFPSPDSPAWLPLHFLGVWDTVASQGLPGRCARFTAPFTEYHQATVPPNVLHARHALALHELRRSFEPLLMAGHGHTSLQQVWFPGAHADVGGGYGEAESGLSNVAVRWMVDEVQAEQLAVDLAHPWLATRRPLRLHHQIRGVFAASWPAPRHWLQAPYAPEEDACQFHASSLQRLLQPQPPAYGSRHPGVAPALREVDALSVPRLVLSALMAHRPAGEPVPADGWWARVDRDELAGADERVHAFLEGTGTVSHDETEAFARALALQVLCVDRGRLLDCVERVLGTTRDYQDQKKPTHDLLDAANQWLERSAAIQGGLARCSALLPRALASECEAGLRVLSLASSVLAKSLIKRTVAAGTDRPLAVQRARFRKRKL